MSLGPCTVLRSISRLAVGDTVFSNVRSQENEIMLDLVGSTSEGSNHAQALHYDIYLRRRTSTSACKICLLAMYSPSPTTLEPFAGCSHGVHLGVLYSEDAAVSPTLRTNTVKNKVQRSIINESIPGLLSF